MPGYTEAILNHFHHPHPIKTELAPHRYASCSFSAASVVGCILYYARAIDIPLLPALIEIGSDQAKATKETLAATKKLLDFVATLPNAVIRYVASDMCL